MSAVSDAKAAQYYQPKPVHSVCGNCLHFTSKTEEIRYSSYGAGSWMREYELRCGLGGFKVGKAGTCNSWRARPPSTVSVPQGK